MYVKNSGVEVSKEIADLFVPRLDQVVCPVHIEVGAFVGVSGDWRKFDSSGTRGGCQ